MKNFLKWSLFIILLTVAVFLYLWNFKHDETLRFLVNSPITRIATASDQADPEVVYQQILSHKNPPPARDDFNGTAFSDYWTQINLNGKGIITHPPEVHAANIELIDGEAVISVYHDPDFEEEFEEVRQENNPAKMQYNNGYMVGMDGYSPTLTENVVIITANTVDPDFGGSTDIWVEERGTFNEVTGILNKPFRTFGVSYIGPESDTFLQGLTLEAVIGFMPVCAKPITDVDVSQYNVYKMVWSLISEEEMRVDLYVNDVYKDSCDFPSFYPGEIQLWADNYAIKDLTPGFFNVPFGRVDSNHFDFVEIYATPK